MPFTKDSIPLRTCMSELRPHVSTVTMLSYWWLISQLSPNERAKNISASSISHTSCEHILACQEVRALWHCDMLKHAVHNANASRQLPHSLQGQIWLYVLALRSSFYIPPVLILPCHITLYTAEEKNQSTEKWLGTSANNFEISFPYTVMWERNF